MPRNSDTFWSRVLFKDFIRHFRKMTPEQVAEDISASMDALDDLNPDGDSFGSLMVRWANDRMNGAFATAARENGKKGGRPKKSPQDAPNGNAGVDMSDAGNGAASKSPTSCDQFTADGDTREDSQAKPDGSAITRNETRAHDALEPSANIYGDAATREGADVSTTVSRNMRRVPQNEAPAHGFSDGRTAQGTMSRSPEAAAQSGKDYDQETDQVSTDGPRQAEALESRRTGAPVRGAKSSTAPVRSSGPMPANVQKVYDFAALEGLDKDDAYECWYVTTAERDGNDADGNPVTNWKAFVRTWCNTRKKKRSA